MIAPALTLLVVIADIQVVHVSTIAANVNVIAAYMFILNVQQQTVPIASSVAVVRRFILRHRFTVGRWTHLSVNILDPLLVRGCFKLEPPYIVVLGDSQCKSHYIWRSYLNMR